MRVVSIFCVLLLALSFAAGQGTAVAPNGAAVADGIQQALTPLQAAVQAVDPDTLHIGGEQKQVLAQSQASLERNLNEAVPGLLAAFRKTPENTGAAFRLYRDLDAVLSVAQHSVEAIPASNSDNDGGNGTDPSAALASATSGLRDSLGKLGDWIEARGAANYASLERMRAQAAAAARPTAAPPPPKTLIINNANAPSPSKKR